MKILIVGTLHQDLTKVRGGVQAVIMNLLEGMKPIPDIEVSVFSLTKESENVSSARFSSNITIFHIPFGKFKSLKLGMLLYGRKRLNHFIHQIEPDIIHFQGSDALLLLTPGLDARKVVITSHGIIREEIKYQISKKRKLNQRFDILIERILLRRFYNIVFISDYSKNYYFKKGLVDQEKAIWRLIYNPVALRFFPSPGLVSSPTIWPEKRSRLVFVYVGAVIPRKGADVLIRALAGVARRGLDFELRIIGGWNSREYEREIREMVNTAKLVDNISFLGWLDQDTVLAELEKADIFVLPSFQETLPISVAEALALGKIVVASDVGGISEMITPRENGFLFNRGNVAELEGIILDLLEGRVDFARLTSIARKRALEEYHPDAVARLTVDFYRDLIRSGN